MKLFISIVTFLLPSILFSQKVGLDILNPSSKFHIHDANPIDNVSNNIQLTNFASGISATDGTKYGQNGILNFEDTDFTFYTNAIERFRILSNGKIGMNTSSMIGQSDFVIRSLNTNGFGGMYVESTNSSTGLPFYGYALNGAARAFHYYSPFQNAWVLNVNGDKFFVNNSGQISNTVIPEQSAILDISSSNRGFLPPRMDFLSRTNLSNPADGLLVYDSTTHDLFVFEDEDWSNLSFWQPYKLNGYSYFNGPMGFFDLTLSSLASDGTYDVQVTSEGKLIRNTNKKVKTVGGYEFIPRQNSDQVKAGFDGSISFDISADPNDDLLAPIQIPNGSRIDSIKIFYTDDSALQYLGATIIIHGAKDDSFQPIYFTENAVLDRDSDQLQSFNASNLNLIVDNERYFYYVVFFCRNLPDFPLQIFWNDISIRSLQIYYSY